MATTSFVSTTLASKTTPKLPLPIIRSAEYEMFCSLPSAPATDGERAAASVVVDDMVFFAAAVLFGAADIDAIYGRELLLLDRMADKQANRRLVIPFY
jgi:hypothetical protein